MTTRTGEYVRHKLAIAILGPEVEVWVAEDRDGRLHFPVHTSCDALGIDWRSQLDNIRDDSRLVAGLSEIRLPTKSGDQLQHCLRGTEYGWWLARLDPKRLRSLTDERRAEFIERQTVLMHLAEDIMVKRTELKWLTPRPKPIQVEVTSAHGALEAHYRCPRCDAPTAMVIDGTGWHLHVGVDNI